MTLRFQVQEMVRVERIVKPEAIQAELDVYNSLMPTGRELSATCFIEVTDRSQIQPTLDRFLGLDQPGAVIMELGNGSSTRAQFEDGRSEADRISAVHYVRFPFTTADVVWWRSEAGRASLAVQLPDYSYRTDVPMPMRKSLARDFD
jgi:hypothetical protein